MDRYWAVMHVGIDLGISGVKAILTDADRALVAQATAPLAVYMPQPSWSERNPADWWQASLAAMARLGALHDPSGVRALGVAGQMHGAVLLDEAARTPSAVGGLVFLPYRYGERTPHNDPGATGVFFGLTTETSRADMTRAVLEGVACALTDGLDAPEVRGGCNPMLTAVDGGRCTPSKAAMPVRDSGLPAWLPLPAGQGRFPACASGRPRPEPSSRTPS